MSVDTFIADSGQECAIEADATADVPTQTAMGGAARSEGDWQPIVSAVPCLVQLLGSKLIEQNNQKTWVARARIFFAQDPVPGGMDPRHRIRITNTGTGGPRIAGTWIIEGIVDPIPSGDHLEVTCQRMGLP